MNIYSYDVRLIFDWSVKVHRMRYIEISNIEMVSG